MRVLIYGGLGFIGANLAVRLSREGHEVFIATRGFEGNGEKTLIARDLEGAARILIYRDPGEALEISRPEAVYNLVGEFFGPEHVLREANLVFVERLCRSLASKGFSGRLVHVSAATVVGLEGSPEIVEEERHLEGVRPVTVFDRLKAEAEGLVARACAEDWVIVRPVLVYGAYNSHPEWVSLLGLVRRGLAPAVRASLSAIEAGELSEVLLRSLRTPPREYFFATECEPYTLADFAEAMAAASGSRVLRIPLPLWLAKILAPSPLRGHMDFLGKTFSCRKMHTLTGYRPARRLLEGVERMVSWIYRVRAQRSPGPWI